MKKLAIFFKPYNKHGLEGYHIPVRNSFSNIVEDEFIPMEARELFEKNFGDKVIAEEEFLDWYSKNADQF